MFRKTVKKACCRLKAARRGAFQLIGRARFFTKKAPIFKKQSTVLFFEFTPEKSGGQGISLAAASDQRFHLWTLTSFLKKAGAKTFKPPSA
ncbi:MAG: hypothetical protein IJ055_07405 [Oscillospiraceae bacterium]|nr:hypothetical protein [Oscillospiraceae bacterium]